MKTSYRRDKPQLRKRFIVTIVIAFLFSELSYGQTVETWLTTSDETHKLSRQNDLTFSTGNETGTIIDISKSITYQTMDGFGASMTGSSAYNIQTHLSSQQKNHLMNDLFTNNGIRLSFIRHTIGASDFSLTDYTYNDIPQGQTDPSLASFSLGGDALHVVPSLKEALDRNPSLKIMGSPWTAPAWMKDEYTLFGSRLNEQWYSTYANYFVKYVQAYQAEGIPIWAVSIQNEPDFAPNYYPSMKWSAGEQQDFLKHLGPAFQNAGLSTGVMILDHNWDMINFPISILNDPDAKRYTIGTAFHAYGGNVLDQTKVHNAHPDKGIWFTEITGISERTDMRVEFRYFMKRLAIDVIRNWGKAVLFWNLALDENDGPQPHPKACSNCRGVVSINSADGSVTKNFEYYALGHFSKFVDQGAVRIFSTETDGSDLIDVQDDDLVEDKVSNVAFENPDGSIVVVVYNGFDEDDPQEPITIRMGNQSFSYTMPPRSAATFKWIPSAQPQNQSTAVKVYINGQEKLSIDDITDTGSYPTTSINAVVGDELIVEVGRNDINIPEIKGLPDLWMAQAFSREGIVMSSKSITPGAYKPWVPFGTTPHTTWVTPLPVEWFNPDEVQSNTYPEWDIVDGKFRFKWTLQRTMDPNLQYDQQTIDYTDKYPDEEVPWWQTWDSNGNPIIDGTGKFNSDGSVPFGHHAKPDGKYPQRQGKFMGQSMQILNAMKGTLKTAYGENTAFSDGNPYTAKTDSDDVYTSGFKDPGTEPFNVATPEEELYRPFVELWKVIPEGESNNPVNDIVTWYQKAIHEDVGRSLPEDYQYDGYEVWEDPVKNPVSKAPGKVILKVGEQTIPLSFNVQSPLENDKFYVLFKANDDDDIRDFVLGDQELVIGMDKHIKEDMVDQLRSNDSKFDLVLPYNSLTYSAGSYIGSYGSYFSGSSSFLGPESDSDLDSDSRLLAVKPLTLNDDGTLSGDMSFNVEKYGKPLPVTVLLTYRRTPESEPVILSAVDFWNSSWVEAVKCLEYHNESESRSLTKFNFHITNFFENQISIAEGLAHGLPITEDRRMNQEFVVMKDEKLTFTLWDDVDFAFKNKDTKWYVSSRKKWQQLTESVAAKRIRTKLYQYADNGALINETILQDFGQGNSLTVDHTFSTVGNYVFEAAMRQDGSAYRIFVKVMDPTFYGTGHEGRVKVRDLLPREVDWINATLAEDQKITGSDYQLAMVSDLKSSYAWRQPKDGGGPRSFMKDDDSGEAKYIDRFAPLNDYADHYVYQLDGSGHKRSAQNIQAFQDYIASREPYFKLLPGVWTNHMDPLGIGDSYGIQDEYNLEGKIKNVTSPFIEQAFTDVQQTQANLYMVDHLGESVNSRSPRNWEIKVPWGSYSKYHGFRLRDVPKSPVNAQKLKEAILSSMKTRTNVNNPMPQVKYGMLDTEEDKLEYMFLLNLKHKRWVVIPNSVNDIAFYQGSDQENLIASGFSSNPEALAGLVPVELDINKNYILVNDKDQCAVSIFENQLIWENVDLGLCAKLSVSAIQNEQYARKIQFPNDIYLTVDDETLSLSGISTESEIIPYKLKGHETEDGIYLGNSVSEKSTVFTSSEYRLIESPDNTVARSGSGVSWKIATGIVGTAIIAGVYLYKRWKTNRNIRNYNDYAPVQLEEDGEEDGEVTSESSRGLRRRLPCGTM